MEIVLQGEQETQDCEDLLVWLKREHIPGAQFRRKRGPAPAGEMGAELIAIVIAILGTPAVAELVRSIHEWIKYRRPKSSVSICLPDGTKIAVNGESVADVQQLIVSAMQATTTKGDVV